MSDEDFNRLMDTLAGFLFGLGFGVVIGNYLLWDVDSVIKTMWVWWKLKNSTALTVEY